MFLNKDNFVRKKSRNKLLVVAISLLVCFANVNFVSASTKNYILEHIDARFHQYDNPASASVNKPKCSTENFCYCKLNFPEVSLGYDLGTWISRSRFSVGVFKTDAWPLYEIRMISADYGRKNVEKLYGSKLTVKEGECFMQDQLTFVDGDRDYEMNPILPEDITCEYMLANGYGCCCANNTDGSVECTQTAKDQTDCTLHCANPTDTAYPDEPNCSARNRKAYVSTSTVDIDLESVRAEAAKQLNPLSWLAKKAGGETATGQINNFIGVALKFFMYAIGSLLLLFYVYAGFLWMTAMGNAEKITKAKTIMFWATLSIVVQLFAYALVQSVLNLLQNG